MARYNAGFNCAAASGGATYFDIRTNSTVEAHILEIGITIGGTSNTEIGLIRSNTVGTASTTWTAQKPDPAVIAAGTTIGTAWSSAPTISGTPYIRQAYIGGTVGNGFIWTFGPSPADGLIIPVSSSLLVWNVGAAQGSVLRCWVVWDE